jgi:isopenicillin-N N-acyltransferase-like protein
VEAVDFLNEIPHATGQHYGMAGPEGLASVEGWASGVAEREPGQRLLHTNHPLYTDQTVGDVEPRYQRTRTIERLEYLNREAGRYRDADGIQELLSDCTVPVSLSADRPSMTFGAVVYECDRPTKMRVAPGPPHVTPFMQVEW